MCVRKKKFHVSRTWYKSLVAALHPQWLILCNSMLSWPSWFCSRVLLKVEWPYLLRQTFGWILFWWRILKPRPFKFLTFYTSFNQFLEQIEISNLFYNWLNQSPKNCRQSKFYPESQKSGKLKRMSNVF